MSYPRSAATRLPSPTAAATPARRGVSCAQIYEQALRAGEEEIDRACRNGWNQQCRAAVGRYVQSTEQQVRESRATERESRAEQRAQALARLPLEQRVATHVRKAEGVRQRHAKQTQELAERGQQLLAEAEATGVDQSHPLVQQAIAAQPATEEESVDLGVGVVIAGASELGIDMDEETRIKLEEVIEYAIRLAYHHQVVSIDEAIENIARILASPTAGTQLLHANANP